jgi:alpha-D-xyloside xylohydrolase
VDGLGRPFVPPLGFVRAGRALSRVTQSFKLGPDEHLYGLGEKFTRLDKSGARLVSWTQDALGSTSERSHKNIPFLWSTRGWGLFVDGGARIAWDLGAQSTQSFTVTADQGTLDAYAIFGPGPAALLKRYADLTGRAPVPPKWSFGLWVSSGGTYRTQAAIEALVDGLNEHGIPAGVIHIDPWWMRWRRYCDFRWDRDAFPHPDSLIRKLHGLGLKLCLWEHPYVSVESDLFELGKRKGWFAKRPDGGVYVIDYGLSLAPRPDGIVRRARRADSWNARVAVIDLTNPEARNWFKDLHRPLLRQGVDVFKTDFGEDIPADAVFHDGTTGMTRHNLYPLLYNQAVAEVTREERGYGLVWSRSGTAGSQRFPVAWSGDPAADWDSLAATIRGGMSAGMSGIPFWSHDIGGYRGKPEPDLYIRWAQFGLLCSHSRMHGDGPREPWIFGMKALEIVRKFIRMRYRLFPYLYSLAHEAAATGLPVLRALPLVFPDDPSVHGHDLQFMLGPWLLIAPVVDPSGARTVYLPHLDTAKQRTKGAKGGKRKTAPSAESVEGGEWIDYWTGERYAAGQSLKLKVPLSRIPIFVRAGAILPMMADAERIPEGPIEKLAIHVYAGAKSSFTLFEDEGRTHFDLERRGNRYALATKGRRPQNKLKIIWR